MCGAEIILLRRLFWNFTILVGLGGLHWDVQFLSNGELESLTLFMDLIYSMSVQGDDCDKSVGSRLRVEVLRFVDIIILHPFLTSC